MKGTNMKEILDYCTKAYPEYEHLEAKAVTVRSNDSAWVLFYDPMSGEISVEAPFPSIFKFLHIA